MAGEFHVMSFNVRYGTANDGGNSWDHRRDLLVRTIENSNPDVLAVQECFEFQAQYIVEKTENRYGFVISGRDNGWRDGGEGVPIFYLHNRFLLVDSGHFWLSENPHIPGSVSWDSSLPRLVSWVVLEDKYSTNKQKAVFVNTHFDHRGDRARSESAKLIIKRLAAYRLDWPVVLCGDFNVSRGNIVMTMMLRSGLDEIFSAAKKEKEALGTFHGFGGRSSPSQHIDWILFRGCDVLSVHIDTFSEGSRYPSDHFPVVAHMKYH